MSCNIAEWEEKVREEAAKGNAQYIKQIAEWFKDATGHTFNFSAADEVGRTALHFAACGGHLNVCRLLLQYGADITLHDKRGNTALHLFVHLMSVINFNDQNNNKLQRATLGNRADVVILLIQEGGANPLQTDYLGKTPFVWLTERFQSSHLSNIKSSSSQGKQIDFTSLSNEIQRNLRTIIECMESWLKRQYSSPSYFSLQFDANFLNLQSQIEKFKTVCSQIERLNYVHSSNGGDVGDGGEDDSLLQLESLLSTLAI